MYVSADSAKKTIAMSWGIVCAQLRKSRKWLKLPDDFGSIETVGHNFGILFKNLLHNLAAQPRVVNHFIDSRHNRLDHADEDNAVWMGSWLGGSGMTTNWI